MVDTTTLNETLRTPVDGTEQVRLATSGANWRSPLSTVVNTLSREKLTANRTYFVRQNLGTITVTIASPAVVSLTSHGLSINDQVYFATTGALPTGITAGTVYFIISAGFGANSFEISTSLGGAAVNTSGTQSGTHRMATGNDANNGSAASRTGAFGSLEFAHDVAYALDTNGFTVTITVASSQYNAASGFFAPGDVIGGGGIVTVGDTTTPSNCTLSGRIYGQYYQPYQTEFKGFKIINSAGPCIEADGGFLYFSDVMEFGTSSAQHINAHNQGTVYFLGNQTISGGATAHWDVSSNSLIRHRGVTITLSGTPAFSSYFAGSANGRLQVDSNTFSGSATGKRFQFTSGGTAQTGSNSLTYFPGNSAGTFDATSGYDDIGMGGKQLLIPSTAFTNTATNDIVLTNILLSAYGCIEIVLNGFVPASSADAWLRLSTDGGSTYAAGATDYSYASLRYDQGADVTNARSAAAQILLLSGLTTITSEGVYGSIKLWDPSTTDSCSRVTWDMCGGFQGGLTNVIAAQGFAKRTSNVDCDAVRLMFSTGNVAASGNYRVYGWLK